MSCVWRGNSKQLLEVLRALGAFTGGRDGNIFLPLAVLAIIGDFRSERRSIDSCPSKLSSEAIYPLILCQFPSGFMSVNWLHVMAFITLLT